MADRKYFELLGVVKREGAEKGFWTRIGTAFPNRDGSTTLRFDYLPTNPETSIQMREPDPDRKRKREDEPPQQQRNDPPPLTDDDIPY